MTEPNIEPQPAPVPPPAPIAAPAPEPAPAPTPEPKPAPIAANGKDTPAPAEPKPYWPEDWRQKAAEHIGAGDEKAVKRELERLKRISDPTAVYASFRELENWRNSGGYVKKPGADAQPEQIAAFAKELGWTEKPEEMFNHIKLENGAVVGDADKPLATSFLEATHNAVSAPDFVNKALGWYYKTQETSAADLDANDEKFKGEALRALKEDFGPAFQRKINAIGTLFDIAPGGANIENEKSLYARLMGGRTADGHVIGNDPDITRWLSALAMDRNPSFSVVEDASGAGQNIDSEIASIEKRMRDDRSAYFKDEKAQARYRELVAARDRMQAKK